MSDVRDPTELERTIVLAQSGRATTAEVLESLAVSPVIVPSATEIVDNLDQLQPVLFDIGGVSMLAVFTHDDQIAEFGRLAAFGVSIVGRSLLASIPPGAGIVVNPSRSIGFELLPEGIGLFLAELRSRRD
ncbi:SseB family protein [Glaciihabitans sp. INWT7]|uniref:SseB family protein n=1 Tax=Glaciihabitans sp. INWT7 TaxID=2596912 RepID=UPI00162327E5|nr:SseB family protein [Glaciihabitans sp. INWT7]QNE47576.1 SseB family protein [Glaciihabitans sp. INWT7]